MKKVISILLTVVLLLSLAACRQTSPSTSEQAPTSSSSSTSDATTPAANGEKVTITIEAVAAGYGQVISDYCDQAFLDDLGVELVFTYSGTVDSYSKQMMELSQGTSTYDIVLFEPAWIGDYGPHLEDLSALSEKVGANLYLDDIMPTYKDIYTSYHGVQVAIPFDGDQFNLFYNTQAFSDEENQAAFLEEYGYELAPPTTWDQYAEMALFFNGRDWDHDGQPEYGTSEAWLSGGYAYWWFMARFAAYGGMYFDKDMNPLINSENGIAALNNMLKTVNATPPGTTSAGYTECEAAFCNGDVPMCICWNSVGKTAMNANSSLITPNVGIALVPGAEVNGQFVQRPTLPTGWVAGIPKYISAEKKELALKVIEKFSSPDVALDAALYHPACVDAWRISTFESQDWANRWTDDGAPALGQQMIDTMKATVEMGFADMQIPGTDEYIQALDKEISAALIGQKTAEQALNDAAQEWNAITERRGFDTQKEAWNEQYKAIQNSGVDYIPFT